MSCVLRPVMCSGMLHTSTTTATATASAIDVSTTIDISTTSDNGPSLDWFGGYGMNFARHRRLHHPH